MHETRVCTVCNMFDQARRMRLCNIFVTMLCNSASFIVAAYFAQMKSYAEELATAGKPLAEDELVSYILAGLDQEYNPLVSALDARTEGVTLDDLFTQMSNFDQRTELLDGSGNGGFKSSANSAFWGRGRGRGEPRGRGFRV